MRNHLFATAIVCAVTLASPSYAGFTTVVDPIGLESQYTHGAILGNIYGTSFTKSDLDYVGDNGVNALRLHDFRLFQNPADHRTDMTAAVDLNVANRSVDQLFSDGWASATAEAKFTLLTEQTFGYLEGDTGITAANANPLFDVGGIGYGVSGSASSIDLNQHDFRWGFAYDFFGTNVVSSRMSDNGGKDHMVTYQVQGLADAATHTTWILAFEDIYSGFGDYNDLFIEVKVQNQIPSPQSILLGMTAIGGLLGLRRRFIG